MVAFIRGSGVRDGRVKTTMKYQIQLIESHNFFSCFLTLDTLTHLELHFLDNYRLRLDALFLLFKFLKRRPSTTLIWSRKLSPHEPNQG